jgi:hypothetical protein
MRKNAKERERHYERVNVAARDAPPRVRLLRREEYIYKKRVRWRRERERAREQKHIKKKKEKKNARECILRRRVAADPPPASQTFLLKGKREMRRRRRRSIGSAPFYSSRARVKLYVLFFSQYRARKSVGQTVRKHKKTVTHFYSYLFHVCDLRRVFLLFLLPSMLSPAVSSLSSSSSSSSSWISSLFMPGAARRRKRDQRNEDG